MNSSLIKLTQRLREQIQLIQRPDVNLMDKITLTRSLLENDAVLNFLKERHTVKRIELFQCFGDFEWYSHQIYYSRPLNLRIGKFKRFLSHVKRSYPYGYLKYGRLIKRRLCKRLRKLIKDPHSPTLKWQRRLDLINSDKSRDSNQQLTLMATYMCHHLITKLPFPYRIVFGKSITYFVLKYSKIDRNVYWLLADLSHGTLVANHFNSKALKRLIKKVITIVKSQLKIL